ncbi:MAG: RluA family pseudouridine synthase [Anaerolineae bacterium]|nr:RluA family pseudouridine synthase [Anaerolineae bacterium]
MSEPKVLIAEEELRLDLLLVQMWPELGRAALRSMVQQGHVRINGELALKTGQYVQVGDRVEVDALLLDETASQVLAPDSLEVVYVDESIVVVDKPAGMATHVGRRKLELVLAPLMSQTYPDMAHVGGVERAGILQHLDPECSGLVLAARTEDSYRILKREITRQRVRGQYMVLVEGRLTGAGEIEAPIGNLKHEREQLGVAREGRSACTHYRPVHHYRSEGRHYSLLEVEPESARLHQIRVHFAWYGYPVVGDKVYGSPRQPEWATRLYLHLSELTFQHPVTAEIMKLDSPLPADIYGVLHFMARHKRG